MPVEDGSNSRARLVDGGCVSFENRRSGKICRANKEQEISAQTWRIPREKMNINVLQGGVEENIGVYAKEKCSIPAGMVKYVPVQTNCDIHTRICFNRDKQQHCTRDCLQRQKENRLYFYRKS